MIGNDIVDFSLANESERSLNRRYLNKIFTSSEQEYIFQSEKQKETLWQIWSMKESTYKLHIRKNHRPFYAPSKLVCTILDNSQGLVEVNGQVYHTNSKNTDEYVHTIAYSIPQDNIFIDVLKLRNTSYREQHQTCCERVRAIYSAKTGISSADISIQKNSFGAPELYANDIKTNLSFSISHHGHYAALALQNRSW